LRDPRTRFALGLSTLAILAACGGADGTIGSADAGGVDAAGAGDAGNAVDSSTADATTTPDASAEAGLCAPLAAGATDVYVDSRFTGTSATGASACPFPTIVQGMTAAAGLTGTRTVHVAGSTPALVYKETGAVTVTANVILQGDGPSKTVVNAAGPCGAGTCAVMVAGGGTIDGVSVTSPGATGGDGIVADLASPAPIVKHVAANGSKGSGVLALGATVLGPNIVANNNGAQGLQSPVGATGVVHVLGGANSFDNNAANGVNIDGAATLIFDGGTASGNALNGVRLAGAVGAGAVSSHVITGLTALLNKNTGISASNGQSLALRSSKLLTNTTYGLFYRYAAGSVLDLGAASAGGNVFGGASIASRNAKAGIYLCASRGAGTQPADGDSWGTCPPTQTSLAGCDVAPSTYADVAYAPAVAGNPAVATSCTIGP
jgi:hypothetical protein